MSNNTKKAITALKNYISFNIFLIVLVLVALSLAVNEAYIAVASQNLYLVISAVYKLLILSYALVGAVIIIALNDIRKAIDLLEEVKNS